MPVRNVESGTKVKENLLEKIPNAKLDMMELDVSSQESGSCRPRLRFRKTRLNRNSHESLWWVWLTRRSP
ncbi:hypothetical protein Ccrd_002526 [Cynara cardunculus var. scolymus]|uniref:Uncharacterized protein n=1 Tax=Cynara cardunculus var. scolymus TaxID=59895 RepID=A0A124SD06_CYNCS|nr:hypothetical protein Ccrd_002526 [Cynara cardunculus var. scolymus]